MKWKGIYDWMVRIVKGRRDRGMYDWMERKEWRRDGEIGGLAIDWCC